MKFLILLLSFYAPNILVEDHNLYKYTPYIVSSPEVAAIEIYQANLDVERFSDYHGRLYEINLLNMSVTEIPIPKIEFRLEG